MRNLPSLSISLLWRLRMGMALLVFCVGAQWRCCVTAEVEEPGVGEEPVDVGDRGVLAAQVEKRKMKNK